MTSVLDSKAGVCSTSSSTLDASESRQLLRKTKIHIEFSDLSYYADVGLFRKVKKRILHGINGQFPGGKLIGILGPSGSGKTTLLHVLSGYSNPSVDYLSGSIRVNEADRDLTKFRSMSSYVTQEGKLHEFLTVRESMRFAADFKLGPHVSGKNKANIINDLLKIFKLLECCEKKTVHLSGGERKRLSLALELIDNPSVIFSDEPTSGLDSLSAAQCMKYLKLLTNYDRTVICTVHQPSASIFMMFDHIYILSDGKCIFQGSPVRLVPHLNDLQLSCPQFHNPADFVIELATHEYGSDAVGKMVTASHNGKMLFSDEPLSRVEPDYYNSEKKIIHENYQLKTLLSREFVKARRNRTLTYLRLIVAVTNSLILGTVFWQIGDDGSKVWFNYNAIAGIILHFMTPALMLTVLTFPTQVPLIKNEHFNKWYSLKSYYLSITMVDLPISFVFCLISNLILYPMTGQPLELYRFEMWFAISFLVVLAAQSLGLLIGSLVNLVIGAFAASAVSFPFLILAGFCINFRDLNTFFYTCTYLSYLRYGIEGLLGAVYGYNRKPLYCPPNRPICHYTYAQEFLKDMMLSADEYWMDVTVLCGTVILFKVAAFYCLKWKVAHFNR